MKTNLPFLCLALAGCLLEGNGKVITNEREIPAFRRISVASGIDLVASTGTRALTIRTDEKIMPTVETFVRNDTLHIRLQEFTVAGLTRIEATLSNDLFESIDVSGGSDVKMMATPVPSFEITASGGSNVVVTGLSSTDFTLDASGGSDVTLSGNATSGEVTAAGGSTLRSTGIPLESLRLEASGGSTMNVRVSSTITGAVSGGSTVTVVGNPSNHVDRSGGSQLSFDAP